MPDLITPYSPFEYRLDYEQLPSHGVYIDIGPITLKITSNTNTITITPKITYLESAMAAGLTEDLKGRDILLQTITLPMDAIHDLKINLTNFLLHKTWERA